MTTLEKTLRAIVIAGVFALPFVSLIFLPSLFFPYITGKNFAFRIIVEVMAVSWLALALVNAEYRPKRSWVFAALLAFVSIVAVANALGAVPFKSFWSNFERMDGWITLAHFFVYSVVAASVVRGERMWRSVWWTTLGVSVYLGLYGFFQMAGLTALGQGGAAGLGARVDATFGNPIYFAVYMLFHIFIAAMLWAQSWAARRPGARLAPSLAYGAIIVLDSAALFLTGTRGTMLGLIGGAVLAAILFAFVAGTGRVRTIVVGLICALVLGGLGLYIARESDVVRSVGFLQRLATISVNDPTIRARFLNMGIAWEGVKERPLLGWGQENYAIVFDKYYDPRMHGQEPWFDRVHNSVFDWWVAGGTLGLLAYLSIFAAALWLLWRHVLFAAVGRDPFTAAERSILTGLLAGYFVHNLTVFDNVTSYILFGTILAFIVWRAAGDDAARPLFAAKPLDRRHLPYVALVAAVMLWALAWWVNADGLAQNRALLSSISSQSAGAARNLELFEEAIAYGSFGTQEAREQLAIMATNMAGAPGDPGLKQRFFEAAVREMRLQGEASPLDARFPLFLGNIYSAYGDHESAREAFVRAHELSPGKQAIYFELGQNALARSDRAEALRYFSEAFALAPDVRDSRIYYAAVAIRLGEYALANEVLAPLIPTGMAADDRIVAAYVSRKDYAPLIPIWQAKVRATPAEGDAYITLAAVHFQLGDIQSAIRVLQEGIEAVPASATQFNALIEDISK